MKSRKFLERYCRNTSRLCSKQARQLQASSRRSPSPPECPYEYVVICSSFSTHDGVVYPVPLDLQLTYELTYACHSYKLKLGVPASSPLRNRHQPHKAAFE